MSSTRGLWSEGRGRPRVSPGDETLRITVSVGTPLYASLVREADARGLTHGGLPSVGALVRALLEEWEERVSIE